MQRVRLIIKGRVQGVGYRYYTRDKASRLGLNGYVRNDSDGSVEVVVEGPGQAISELIALLRIGPSYACVSEIRRIDEEYRNEFESFNIRRG